MAYITIHGRLTADPELKSGNKDGKDWNMATFTVAVNNRYPSEEASFFNCSIWGNKATAICNYFGKGSEIVLYGNFEQEPYTDNEGNVKRPWKMRADGFDFVGNKTDKNPESNTSDFLKNPQVIPPNFEEFTEEVPF